jgi:hypothetical protein
VQSGSEAIKRNPNFVPAYQLVAAVYRQTGNAQAARAYDEHARKLQSMMNRQQQ